MTLGTQRDISRQPKKKDKTNQEHKNREKDKVKAKFHNFLFTNISQPQTQASKKNKYHKSNQGSHLATKIYAIKIASKNMKKTKNLSYTKCYTCK